MLGLKSFSGFLRGCFAILSASVVMAESGKESSHRFEYSSGAVLVDGGGLVKIVNQAGDCEVDLSVALYETGWRRTSQENFSLSMAELEDSLQWTGSFGVGEETVSFEQRVWEEDDSVLVEYRIEGPGDLPFQPQSRGPFVSVMFPGDCFEDQNIMVGGKTITLPISNVWGDGNKVVIPGIESELTLADWTVMSVWNTKHHREARLQLASQAGNAEGPKSYGLRISIGTQKTEVSAEPVEPVLSIKLNAYPRVLELPTIAGVNTAVAKKWLDQGGIAFDRNEKSEAKHWVNKVENWMDSQSRVYDVADRIVHLELAGRVFDIPNVGEVELSLTEAVRGLNTGDSTSVNELVEELREELAAIGDLFQERYGYNFYPKSNYNPYSWVKSFDSLGFVGPSDALTPGEPDPGSIGWLSGGGSVDDFSLSLLPESVKSLDSFDVDRSWVRSRWISAEGASYTFSVLTPLIAVDDVRELPVSGLPSRSERIYIPGENGEWVRLQFEGETSDSVDLTDTDTPWIWLSGTRFSILLFPSIPVQEIKRTANGVNLALEGEGSVSMMCLPSGWTKSRVAEEAGFWARVAVSPPEDVVEVLGEGEVTYRYLYADRPNSFGIKPLKIAPLPPLTVLRGKGDWEESAFPTVAGRFQYVDGDRVSVDIPPRKFIQRRGINEYLSRLSSERVEEFSELGVDWIRVCFGNKDWKTDPDQAYRELGVVLERLRTYRMKALIDPHDYRFAVHDWEKGIPTDPQKRQEFLDLWQNIATICVNYSDVVVGYDLYNELRVRKEGWHTWDLLATEAIEVIRPIDQNTPIYISGVDMSNPSGYLFAKPIEQENLIYSFHFYAPHSFSHQKIFRASTNDAFVFYPGWIPQIDWKNKEVYGKAPLQWWDRWVIEASMFPVLEFAARYDVSLHCGEVAPIGYSRKKASESSGFWTQDSLDVLESYGIPWHLWNQGFGLVIEPVAEDVFERWADDSLLPVEESQ